MKQPVAVLLLLALLTAVPGFGRASTQDTRGGWRTIAGGDEILSLAADPWDPTILWAGTEGGGAVVWDLDRAEHTQYVFPDQPGLASNTIYDIAFGPNATWLATSAGVTQVVDADWTTYGLDEGLPSLVITSIAVGGDGAGWAGSHANGIAVLDPGSSQWRVHEVNDRDPEQGPAANQIADIAADVDGSDRVWVAHGRASTGDRAALSVYDPAQQIWEFVYSVGPAGDPTEGPAGDQIMALDFDDESGALWLGSWAEGVLYYDGDTWGQYQTSAGLCGKSVWAIAADRDEVWAACGDDGGGAGAARWLGDSWETWTTDDLPTDVVTSIAIADGVAYLGTNGPGDGGSGIVPFDREPLDPLTTAPTTPWSNDITALLFDQEGTLWVGTRGAGLMKYDPYAGLAEWEVFTEESTGGRLVGDTITDLALREGQLWIASTKTIPQGTGYADGGVSMLDLDTEEWDPPIRSSSSSPGTCIGLPDDEVSSLAVAPDDGRVWMGIGIGSGGPGYATSSQQGDGIVAYDPDPSVDEWFCFTYEDTGEGLAGNTVLDLAFDDAALWVAASYHISTSDGRKRGGGVSRFEEDGWTAWVDEDEGFVTYSASGVDLDRDPVTGDVRSVFVDHAGEVWAGTYDLERGNLSDVWPLVDAVVNHRVGSSWESAVFGGSGWVSAIAEDGLDQVWVGTTRGHIQEFSPAGGMPQDTAFGGAHVWNGSDWTALLPPESGDDGTPSGIAAKAITALVLDPMTGDMWIGTENGGLSVFEIDAPFATSTPCVDCATKTPMPPDSPTQNPISTVVATSTRSSPAATPPGDATPVPTGDPEPEPPPDVPEASTIVLLGAGLAGLAAWHRRRQLFPS